MILVVCPGQGSQTPGFLTPWLDEPSNRGYLETLSDAASVDLVKHGTISDADTIKDTSIAQCLIVAAGLLTLKVLQSSAGASFSAVSGFAGHSVGEITAASAAGVLDPLEAMKFVSARGKAMAAAASIEATGMSAVLGLSLAELEPHLVKFGLSAANLNGAGQIVIAGKLEALAEFAATPPSGARVIALHVAGAFHSRYMATAQEVLAPVAAKLHPRDPAKALYTNSDGSLISSGRAALDLIVKQVVSPVRWDLCMESFVANGVTAMIELSPAGALAGMAKRAMPGVECVKVRTPDDLPEAIRLLEQSGATGQNPDHHSMSHGTRGI